MPNWLESWWLPLAVTVAGGITVGIILLVLEYRTGWFAQRRSPSTRVADEGIPNQTMGKRKHIPKETETELLVRSRRRCCLCYGLNQDLSEKKGQIAHLGRDPSNSDLDNLAWMCFEHHDQYDSRTSQSKGLTIGEVKGYRKQLYETLEGGTWEKATEDGRPPTEVRDTVQIGNPIIRLLRGVSISRILQIGGGRIEVSDEGHSDEEDRAPQ